MSAAATGEEGLELFTKGGIDLVLLDLMLPGIDGTALCRRIREQSRVPIIMLTAKSAEIDKVVGLEIGADDYVTKPYSFRELLARIRAVLRRNQGAAEASGAVDDDIPLVCGDISMQVGQHQVTVRGESVFFPLKEFELLEYLMQNKGRVMTRHQLIDRIWGSDYVGDTKTLDVHVKRVRSKIEEDPAHPQVPDHRARPRLQDRHARSSDWPAPGITRPRPRLNDPVQAGRTYPANRAFQLRGKVGNCSSSVYRFWSWDPSKQPNRLVDCHENESGI